jgi:hypothetical protein
MSTHRIAIVTAALALLLIPDAAPAQAARSRAPARFPATVAMVDSLPVPGVSFVVQRRPDLTPSDLILVRESATPAEVSDAVRTLLTARLIGGDLPTSHATIRLRPREQSQAARREFPWTPRVLADLRRATTRSIPDVGTVRAVDIWLPSQARHDRVGLAPSHGSK